MNMVGEKEEECGTEVVMEKIPHSEGNKALERVLKYAEQLEETSSNEVLLLKRLLRDVVRKHQASS